jgi:acetyltransferase-like isoleucine patch superfamily enzyme
MLDASRPDARAVFSGSVDIADPKAEDDLPAFASFGHGSHIVGPFTVSCPERIDIGEDVYIGPGAWFSVVDEHNGRRYEPRVWIGHGTSLGPGLVISCIGEISIGARVLGGPRVFIGDTYHDYRAPDTAVIDQPMSDPRPVLIGSGAFLGVGSVILPGVTIGERAYVGANSVVTNDVPPNSVVGGVPARIIKRWDGHGERWVDERGSPPGEAHSETSAQSPANTVSDDRQADVLRERIAHLEQRLAISDSRRIALDEQLRTAGTQHGQDIQALHAQHAETRELLERAERARTAAEYWLAEHRRSPSWRITEPLRAAKRLASNRRSRS